MPAESRSGRWRSPRLSPRHPSPRRAESHRALLSTVLFSGLFSGLLLLPAACAERLPPPEAGAGAREGAQVALAILEERGEAEAWQAVLDGLESPSGEVRARAARAAARWGPALPQGGGRGAARPESSLAVAQALVRLVRTEEEVDVLREAAFALGARAEASGSAALAELLLHSAAPLREAAVAALSAIPGTPSSLLAPSLTDPSPEVRGSAALALARLDEETAGTEVVGAALEGRVEVENDERVRWKNAFLIASRPRLLLRPRLHAHVLAALARPNFFEAALSAEALAKAGTLPGMDSPRFKESVEALRRAARDPASFPAARRAASLALGALAEAAPGGSTGAAGVSGGAAPGEEHRAAPVDPGAPGRGQGFRPVLAFRAPLEPGGAPRRAPRGERPREPRLWITIAGKGRVGFDLSSQVSPRTVAALLHAARSGRLAGEVLAWAALPEPPERRASGSRGPAGAAPGREPAPGPILRGTLVALPAPGPALALFVASMPLPELEGSVTVAGRVVEGMEVLERLEGGERIEEASVEARE